MTPLYTCPAVTLEELVNSRIDETLIVAQVHVGLGPIPRDKDLAVLVRGHGAGVDIQVGVKLLDGDGEAGALQGFALWMRR